MYLKSILLVTIVLLVLFAPVSRGSNQNEAQQLQSPFNYPIYMQSPIADNVAPQNYDQRVSSPTGQAVSALATSTPIGPTQQQQNQQQSFEPPVTQRDRIPKINNKFRYRASARSSTGNTLPPVSALENADSITSGSPINNNAPNGSNQSSCLYDKSYFKRLGDCLAHSSSPTMGLPAFKNEDLLVRAPGLRAQKTGCSFILSNGLFKNQHVTKFSVDSDNQCLDNSRVDLSMSFSNATLYYLWTLRCLNRADQVQDDSSLDANTMSSSRAGDKSAKPNGASICVGSSQNFGFSSLQLATIDAQVELATDIYKNWRIVDISLAIAPASQQAAAIASKPSQLGTGGTESSDPLDGGNLLSSHITDFTFETLDGDELNWRYQHLFRSWSLNRMHGNFLEQYRRFLWISLQRCLADNKAKLPVRLFDLFGDQHYQ